MWDCSGSDYCLNQAFSLALHTRDRPGKVPVGETGRSQDSLYGGGGD